MTSRRPWTPPREHDPVISKGPRTRYENHRAGPRPNRRFRAPGLTRTVVQPPNLHTSRRHPGD